MAITKDLRIENAKIRIRNFEGVEKQYNRKGDRNFCIFLEPEVAEDLKRDGWLIKYLPPRDPDAEPQAMLRVKVRFDKFPPIVNLVTAGNHITKLYEDDVKILDTAEIENVDVVISPYNWEMNGKHGITAYLKKIWVKIVEDDFEKKYRNVPDKDDFNEEDEIPF
jgi:hypothetical protein